MFKLKQNQSGNFKSANLKEVIIWSVLIVFLFVLLIFLLNKSKKESKVILSYKNKISSKISILSFLASTEKQYQESKKYISALNNVLPGEDKLLDFKDEVRRIANKNDVGLGFKFGNSSSNLKGYKIINFELLVSGPLKKTVNFINDLENTFYIVKLNNLTFQRNEKQNRVEARIKGSIFYK